MARWWRVLLGAALVLGGAAFALLNVGVLLIADCGPACQARGEQAVAALLVLAGGGAAIGGALLAGSGRRA